MFSMLACCKRRWLDETTSEERYQRLKKSWYDHKSSWFMRNAKSYDRYDCYNGVCVPECRYYPKEARIEDEDIRG